MKPSLEEVRAAAVTLREFALLNIGPDLRTAIDVAATYIEGMGVLNAMTWQKWQKEAESPWKPIETAPKDGTEVLIYAPAVGVLMARWNDDIWVDAMVQFNGACPAQPTLWMPVPVPP